MSDNNKDYVGPIDSKCAEVKVCPLLETHVLLYVMLRKRTVRARDIAVADSENELPSHWEPMDESGDFSYVHLQTISEEFKNAEKKFNETMKGHTIITIERVQNADLWMEYIQ